MGIAAMPTKKEAVWGDPVSVTNDGGEGAAIVVCEHAANFIPPHLHGLGLDAATRVSHVAWDPGALAVAEIIARRLDGPLIASNISRLVYDCNRPPNSASAMPAVSEIFEIPGNASLDAAEKAERVAHVYAPFRDALAGLIDRRLTAGLPAAIVTIHSFTPVYKGRARPVELGILYDADTRLADAMLELPELSEGLDVRRNEPYGPADGVTHTLRLHALPRGLLNVMIEVRNDLIREPAEQAAMAERLSGAVGKALALCTAADGNRVDPSS